MKQAVILAGGKGERLRERLGELPKPLIDVCGLPLLQRQMQLLSRHAFTDVLVLVSHGAQHIADYCAAHPEGGINIRCLDDGQPRGTAGATLAAFDHLADEFLLMYGDTMLEVDLARFYAEHARVEDSAATLFLHPNDHPQDSDLVELDRDGFVSALHPYPHDPHHFYPNLVNAALYWMRRQALSPWRGEAGALDFGRDLFPLMLRRGLKLRGYRSPEYIHDVGTPTRLDEVCADLRSGKIARASLDRPQPIVFLDRDGTLNRTTDYVRTAEQFELLPGVEAAIRRLNRSEYRCCVVTNQAVIARGECSLEELHRIHHKMETLLGRQGAFLDRIYYCPHHPDSGFPGERPEFKRDCDCRKPKTGMVELALQQLHGSRQQSWLIGDTSVDLETARRAGVKPVLLQTGHAGLDGREWATADAVVPDLACAVAFILDQHPRLLRFCRQVTAGVHSGAIVLVGGPSRSGKSTFAAGLRDALLERGQRSHVLSIDRWLKPPAQRGPGVLGRYDMQALKCLADRLAGNARRPHSLTLPGYHKVDRRAVPAVEVLTLSDSDVLLVEGTVALAIDIPGVETHRFHVVIDEALRKERVLREYRLRGYSSEQSLEIYLARQTDEYPVIEALARGATRIALADVLG